MTVQLSEDRPSAKRLTFLQLLRSLTHGPGDEPADANTDKAHYKALVDEAVSLALKPLLPPDPILECVPKMERADIESLARMAAESVVEYYCTELKSDPCAIARRDFHVKQTGFVRANFTVHPDLPARFAIGVFACPGMTYPALLRFSNGNPSMKPDRSLGARGFAIRLHDVPGTKLLPYMPDGQQDFVLSNYPTFPAANVAIYLAFLRLSNKTGQKSRWRSAAAWAVLLLWMVRHWSFMRVFVATLRQRVADPLEIAYYSMAPFRFGDTMVVRYIARPARPTGTASPDYLSDRLAERLAPPQERAAFDFLMQIRHAPTPADVENGNKPWRRAEDIEVPLARITIPSQESDSPSQLHQGEAMAYSPWNGLREHRPLGGLNRVRPVVYRASMEARSRLNARK